MLFTPSMHLRLFHGAISALALVTLVIPTVSLGSPLILKDTRAIIRSMGCELFLSSDRKSTFVKMITSRRALQLEGEEDYDIFGILHELAGVSYSQIRHSIEASPARRNILLAQGGASVGVLLNTPVRDLMRIDSLIQFKHREKIVDLGSGHGAPSFFFGALFPDTEWLGLELVGEKVFGAEMVADFLELDNTHFLQVDLSDPQFALPKADTYYLLNPVESSILADLFEKMREVAKSQPIRIVGLGLDETIADLDLSWLRHEWHPPTNPLESSIVILTSK